MANSNNIEKYRPLIGQSVKFFREGLFGREHLSGELIDLQYNDRERQLYAAIDMYTTVLHRRVQIKVPVTNITIADPAIDRYQPMPENPNNFTTNNVIRKPEDTIKLGKDTYIFDDASVFSTMKIGHEVVWLLGNTVSPLIGKITRLGARFCHNGDRETVAIVQFDQQTCNLPRYIQYEPANRNIVGLNDLLLLSDWLKTEASLKALPLQPPTGLGLADQVKRVSDLNFTHFNPDAPLASTSEISRLFKKGSHTRLLPDDNVPSSTNLAKSEPKTPPVKIPLVVRSQDGKSFSIQAHSDWTVLRLKKQIQEMAGVANLSMTLHHEARQLKDELFLSFYELSPDTVIQARFAKISNRDSEEIQQLERCPQTTTQEESLQRSTAQEDTNVHETRKKKVTWLIGNCIALANGIQPQNVESIKKGYLVIARTDTKKLISGETRMTCTINNLEPVYAGVRFEKRLILNNSDMKTRHLDDSKAGEYCEKCKGEKSLFIPCDIIGNTKRYSFHVISDEDVVS